MARNPVTRRYPRATENRLFRADAALRKTRNAFLKVSGKNFIYLQVLFLALFCWIFGSLYQQETHVKNMHVAFVDYENNNGSIGAAIRSAYSRLQSSSFPTLVEVSPADYPTPADLREAVCKIHYWGALYVSPGASARLEQALTGNTPLPTYDPTNVLTYIWNEARYPQVVDAAISSSLQTLSESARVAYTTANGTGRVTSLTTPGAISAFAQPWTLTAINIRPTTQGSRAIYNTLVMILLMVQEFFYLGIINALYANFKIYNRASPWRIALLRGANSALYTLAGSLCTAGAIWAFRAGWEVGYGQWAITWVVLWLFAHVNFQVLDVVSIWVPPGFVPMGFVTWLVWNVSSILLPFELSPGFYRLGYAFPAREVYQVLVDVWSGGCNPELRVALPVLFAWEVVGAVLSAVGVFRRCHYATVAQEEQERAFQEKVQAAMAAVTRAREAEEEREKRREEEAVSPDAIEKISTRETEADLERGNDEGDTESELSAAISRVDERIRRQESKASRVGYGPSFGAPFTGDDNDDQ
ncbi:putative Nitrosoguanidine resistance protein SNG1 [Coniochaeta hoffmannii]|uniref:Nitrosoguanidine resistance protein SNG1 n=1 Tax=Coniochaeta hoffmannii TaxID=91930 RepID=A0AA38S9L2_9PEZI|nr:putative Nitrosoguanidine resistance protein SNG1 [Coniochaeta hoffmannii]